MLKEAGLRVLSREGGRAIAQPAFNRCSGDWPHPCSKNTEKPITPSPHFSSGEMKMICQLREHFLIWSLSTLWARPRGRLPSWGLWPTWPHWSYLQRNTLLAPLWRDPVLPETTTGGVGRAGAWGALAASAALRLHPCHTVILQNTAAPTTKRQVTLTAVTAWGLAVLTEHVLCAGHGAN